MMRGRGNSKILSAGVALFALMAVALCAQTVQNAGYTASTPVDVRIYAEGKGQDGRLVGFTDDGVVLRYDRDGRRRTIPVRRVDSVFFDVAVPRTELNDALVAGNFGRAAALLYPVVRPLMPFLHLRQNNGVDIVHDAAHYMLKSTGYQLAAEAQEALGEKDAARAKAAAALFNGLGKAGWSELALVGQARSAEALLAIGKRDMADDVIANMAEPFPDDRAMGSYWMVRSRMAYDDGDFSAALDGAVRAVCFANKDIDVFLGALLMSARCYEKLASYYRARDVYYELARLFPGTPEGRSARAHLRHIRDAGHTKNEEEASMVNVFFGVPEDMNQLVETLLDKFEDE